MPKVIEPLMDRGPGEVFRVNLSFVAGKMEFPEYENFRKQVIAFGQSQGLYVDKIEFVNTVEK